MKLKVIVLVGGATLLIAGVAGAQMLRGGYDEPAFELIERDGDFELRKYRERIVAETTVNVDDWRKGTSAGFGRLANYIFAKKRGGEDKIAMTTPVETAQDSDDVIVVFTMPPEYRMEELPKPEDDRVRLRQLPAATVAVLSFSGVARKKSVAAFEARLRAELSERDLEPTSELRIAQYDPPWIPGPFRRNELMLDVQPVATAL